MYNISSCFRKDQGLPNVSPWGAKVTGHYFGWLLVQCLGVLLVQSTAPG